MSVPNLWVVAKAQLELPAPAYRDVEFDRSYESLLFFPPSILGEAAVFVMTPTLPDDGEFDLARHNFPVAPWAYCLAAAYVALAVLADLLVPSEASTPRPVALILTLALLLLSFAQRPRLHHVALARLWMVHVTKFAVGTR